MNDSSESIDFPPWAMAEWNITFAARDLRISADLVLKPYSLNLPGWAFLALLHNNEPLSQTYLGKSFGIGRASAGTIIDDLENKGFIKRTLTDKDRRVRLVELTPKGEKTILELREIQEELSNTFMDGISNDERRQLDSILQKLRRNLKKIPEHHKQILEKGD
jgi:MarR family transcriptional regulator for hemolysin